MSEFSKAGDRSDELFRALSADEKEVYNVLIDYVDTLPEGFFVDNSVDELNAHFGGHDDMVVTENVRQALDAAQEMLLMLDDMAGIYGDLPEGDDEEEE